MNNDIRKLFSEKNIIEKKLNDIKMKIMLSGCDKNKDDDNSKEKLENPFKFFIDMLKDAAVGTGLMAWGVKWFADGKPSIPLKIFLVIIIAIGFILCVVSISWFVINACKINHIKSEKWEHFCVSLFAIVSVIVTVFYFCFIISSVNSEKSKENICYLWGPNMNK